MIEKTERVPKKYIVAASHATQYRRNTCDIGGICPFPSVRISKGMILYNVTEISKYVIPFVLLSIEVYVDTENIHPVRPKNNLQQIPSIILFRVRIFFIVNNSTTYETVALFFPIFTSIILLKYMITTS